jgi:hypothetical protein
MMRLERSSAESPDFAKQLATSAPAQLVAVASVNALQDVPRVSRAQLK